MGYSASYVIPRFVKYAGHGRNEYAPDGKNGALKQMFPDGSGSSLYYVSDKGRVVEIQSYGSHFPLARLQVHADGTPKRWILNGDWWAGGGFGKTNDHNAMAREAAQKSGVPWIIVPFSALRSANIDIDTIVPVEVAPERWTAERHETRDFDRIPVDERKQHVFVSADGEVFEPPHAADGTMAWPHTDNSGEEPRYVWRVSRRTELEGWQYYELPGPEFSAGNYPQSDYREIQPGPDRFYRWTERVHHLGEAVFQATYTTWDRERRGGMTVKHTRYFLSAFDRQERPPLYFLAELPNNAGRPAGVADAFDMLKPDRVRDAEIDGVPVQRQGDVFAIATQFATRDLPGPTARSHKFNGSHVVSDARIMDGVTYARGKIFHRPPRRRADHATQVLGDGKTWYRLLHNTVPRSAGAWDGGQPRAWAMSGRVD